MRRHLRQEGHWGQYLGFSLGLIVGLGQTCAWAIFLDQEQTLRFNGRVYNRNVWATQAAADNTRLQREHQKPGDAA